MLQDKQRLIVDKIGDIIDEVAADAGCPSEKLYTAIRKRVAEADGAIKKLYPFLALMGVKPTEVSEVFSVLDKLYLEE